MRVIEEQQTHLIRIQPGEVSLGKLSLLHEAMRDVLEHGTTPLEGSSRVDVITVAPAPYRRITRRGARGSALRAQPSW